MGLPIGNTGSRMTDVVSIDNFIKTKAQEALCAVKGRKIADVVEGLSPNVSAETKLKIIKECTRLYLESLFKRKTK